MEQFNTSSVLALSSIDHEAEGGIEALEAVLRDRLRDAEVNKQSRTVQYFTNAAYLLGNTMTQFYFSAESGFGIHRFGLHDNNRMDNAVAKSADNHLIRATESVVAMLTSSVPEPRVEPNSELPEDEDAADLCEIALRVVWEKPLNMSQRLRDAALIMCIAGTAIAETEYGETDFPVQVPRYVKRRVKNPLYEDGDDPSEREVEVEDQDGFEISYRRDIQVRVWSPFQISPDPQATSPEDMIWVARTTFEDIDWVAQTFAKDEEGYIFGADERDELKVGIRSDRFETHSLYWWSRLKDILESPHYMNYGGLAPGGHGNGRHSAMNQTTFTVIDVKPSEDFPKGRTIIMAGHKIIYVGQARAWSEQYPWRWHGYNFTGWFRVPGRFWSVALLSQLVPLQKKINAIDALVHINRTYMAFGQYWLPKSAKVQEGRISGFPGEHYTYNDTGTGAKPERVKNDPIPADLFVERDQLKMAIDRIAAISATDEQVSPSAARAGVMLDFLRSERLQSKKPMLSDWEHFIEGIAQNILIELQLNLVQEDQELTQRMRIAAREYSNISLQAFLGQSLRDHHSVKIDITSGLMSTPEAMSEKALAMLQYSGGQVSPSERQAILKAIGMERFMRNPDNSSVERARRIVSRVRSGQLQQIYMLPGENAQVMVGVFTDEILSDRFNDLGPEQKTLLITYHEQYQAMAQQQQMQAMQMQAMAQRMAGQEPA